MKRVILVRNVMIKIMKSPGTIGLYISPFGAVIWLSRHWAVIWKNKPVPRFGKIRQIGPFNFA